LYLFDLINFLRIEWNLRIFLWNLLRRSDELG
jgi:hypothetical protein